MSEQINEQVVDNEVVKEVKAPEPVIETPNESLVKPQTYIVMPTKATIGQRIVDTAVTMVASTVVVGFTNVVVKGVTTLASSGAKALKAGVEHHKERKLIKKAEKEAAQLKKAAAAQETAEEAAPETVNE